MASQASHHHAVVRGRDRPARVHLDLPGEPRRAGYGHRSRGPDAHPGLRRAPRPIIGVAKRESWHNPLFNFLFNLWHAIPIDRGQINQEAFRLSIEAGQVAVSFPSPVTIAAGQILTLQLG